MKQKETKYYFINGHVYKQKDGNQKDGIWTEVFVSRKEYQKLISSLK